MISDETPWLPVIGRSLAYLALHRQELGNASISEKAAFLEALGLPRSDVAAMLGTSVESVSELLRRRKKNQGAHGGKTKSS